MMSLSVGRLFDVLGLIVGVAAMTVFFRSPETKAIITASGNAFSGSLRAAQGE